MEVKQFFLTQDQHTVAGIVTMFLISNVCSVKLITKSSFFTSAVWASTVCVGFDDVVKRVSHLKTKTNKGSLISFNQFNRLVIQ